MQLRVVWHGNSPTNWGVLMLDDDKGSTALSADPLRSEGALGLMHQALAVIQAEATMSDAAAFVVLVTRSVEWEIDVREAATRIVKEPRPLV